MAARSARLARPQAQEILDNYVLTANSRGAPPKQVPSKLNGTFEYFTSPYEQKVITWCVGPIPLLQISLSVCLSVGQLPCASCPRGSSAFSLVLAYECPGTDRTLRVDCVRRTPSYVMGALKKEVMEKVPWIAPAAATLYGCVWYAQDYKRKEDMHHRF